MMWEYLALLPLIFPVGFIFYKKGGNKFLFISSVVGIAILTEFILLMISLPINLFLVFIVPSIAEIGYAEYLTPFIYSAEIIGKYSFMIFDVLILFLPFVVYRKYAFFQTCT